MEFETDAVNDYFKRPDCPGSLIVDPPNIIEHSNLWNGRLAAQFRVPWNAKPGDHIEVTVKVEDVETEMRDSPFISRFRLIAEKEAEPRPRGTNGGSSRSRPGPHAAAPTLAIPRLQWKNFNDPHPSLQVRYDDEGKHEYFANLDNAYLTTELVRAKEEDRQLIKFWFGYGLLLCALGMLKEHQERAEVKKEGRENGADDDNNGAETDELERVSFYCDGIARVIIPMIRTLYRGPQIAGI